MCIPHMVRGFMHEIHCAIQPPRTTTKAVMIASAKGSMWNAVSCPDRVGWEESSYAHTGVVPFCIVILGNPLPN